MFELLDRRHRQYAGLVIIVVAFVGGILGWSWAALSVDREAPPPRDATDTTAVKSMSPAEPDEEGTGAVIRVSNRGGAHVLAGERQKPDEGKEAEARARAPEEL